MTSYQNKQIAVLGLGRSGEAAALLLVALGARVTLLDSLADPAALGPKIEKLAGMGVVVRTGLGADQDQTRYDLAVLSPGINPKVPLVQNLLRRQVPVIAEIELAYEQCARPVIGITGTNGKTTTTELVVAMLTGAGVRTVGGGNLGKPFCEVVREGSAAYDVITLEVSSFQLERIRRFRPAISVWLNLAPDHLDRYEDVEEYRRAKLRIFENQTHEDWAVVNFRDHLPALSARRITFSAYELGADFELRAGVITYRGEPMLDQRETALRGRHNAENLMAALGVGLARGLTGDQMKPGLRAYRPAPHRTELVRRLGGVDYVNDSKATNLDALEKALDSVGAQGPVILLAGGKDKGFGFEPLTNLVAEKVRWAVLIGEMAPRIAEAWHHVVPCECAASLPEAVRIAWSLAQPGETVLFSPGTSSFDMFRDYADRGDRFRALVSALPPTPSATEPSGPPAPAPGSP